MAVRKLVRDGIPDIIRREGAYPVVYRADAGEYRCLLRAKLCEEVAEFLKAPDSVEELADILEVVRALAVDLGTSREGLDDVAADKARKRGGFVNRVVWLGNEAGAAETSY